MTNQNKTNKFGRILYDHWLGIFGAVASVVGATTFVVFFNNIIEATRQFIAWQYSGWVVSAAIAMTVLISLIIQKLRKHRSHRAHIGVIGAHGMPHKLVGLYECTRFGVAWKLYVGTDNIVGYFDTEAIPDHDLFGYVDGPYCMHCNYELDKNYKKKTWTCANGHKPIAIPKNIQDDTIGKVTKIFEAEYFKRKKAENARP